MSNKGNEILVKNHDLFKSIEGNLYFWLVGTQIAFVQEGQAKIVLSQGNSALERLEKIEKLIPRDKYKGEQLYNEPVLISSDLIGQSGGLELINPRLVPEGLWFSGWAGEAYKITNRGIVWQSGS